MSNLSEVLSELHNIVADNSKYTTWTVSSPHLVMLWERAQELERDACARVCEELEYIEEDGSRLTGKFWARAIRERGRS
jgi:hypothetical protein